MTERLKAIRNGQGNDDERDMLSSIAGPLIEAESEASKDIKEA